MKIMQMGFLALSVALTWNSASAQIFGTDTYVTDDSAVLTTGTEVWGGRDVGGGDIVLNNGVSFNTVFTGGTNYAPSTIAGYTGISVRTDGAYRGDYTAEGAFSDGNLNNALQYDFTGGYGQFYVQGLTPGDTYVIQLLATKTENGYIDDTGPMNPNDGLFGTSTVKDNTPGGNGASGSLSWGQTVAGVGTGTYTLTDTFVADASGTEFLDLSSNGSPTQIAAAQIRLVPEPSTYALMLGSLGLLALILRRRFAGLMP